MLTLLPNRVMGVMDNSVLLAVPLFVFMGIMLEKSGLAERMLSSMTRLFGKVRGGMAVSVVIVGALLAASTGIVGATVITMGLISLPPMLKEGYPAPLATGVIAASGTLGQIIPPSVVLVLLGSVLQVSVGALFRAALYPSLLLVVGVHRLRPITGGSASQAVSRTPASSGLEPGVAGWITTESIPSVTAHRSRIREYTHRAGLANGSSGGRGRGCNATDLDARSP